MYVEAVKSVAAAKTPPAIQIETETKEQPEMPKQDAEHRVKEDSNKEETFTGLKMSQNEELKKAMEKINAQLPHSEARFSIHEKTNRVMIKLVDKNTKEVVKEIPPEKTLDIIAKCQEMAGVLIDENL